MFRKTWFRAALVLTILASLVAAPLYVSAQAENGITSPADGATISGTVTVTGYADDPNFRRWELFVYPGGNDNARIWVASGNTAGAFSVDVDTTRFPDGDHAFALRVVTNPRQNYTEYINAFTLANAAAPAPAPAPAAPVATPAPEAPAAPAPAPAEPAAPANGLNLADGATVSGTVTVTGYADDPNFRRWDLFVLPGGNDSAKIWVASGNTAGEFTVTLDTTRFPDGDHAFSLRVVTNPRQNYTEYVTNFTLANAGAPAAAPAPAPAPAATPAPEAPAAAAPEAPAAAAPANGLNLTDGATVSGTVTITGYADDPNFRRWDLFVLPGGSDAAKIWVASGSTAGEFTVTLDTTRFPNGEHAFSLRVVTNPRQNYTEYITNFVLANPE
jgi:nucleoid-associated protein YgaU